MKKNLLYMLTPTQNMSPFDITLAADSGFDQIYSTTGVIAKDVKGVVQDAIFARPPGHFKNTGVFIGGRNPHVAKDMFQAACDAMVGPFEASVFVDPNGAYTTAASIVALIEHKFSEKTGRSLKDVKTAVFGVGPVGMATAVLLAKQGADSRICKLTASDEKGLAIRFGERYGKKLNWVLAETHSEKLLALQDVEILVCAAKAGIRILEVGDLAVAKDLILAADTNAVPPAGIGEVAAGHDGDEITSGDVAFRAIGPMTIGNVKYKVQFEMFKRMLNDEKAAYLDFPDAFQQAKSVVKKVYEKENAA